jgi:hypothetical protein
MKTTILTIAIALITVFGISSSTFAASKTGQQVSTMLTGISNVSEIEVHGNVQLYVTTGSTDQVKVYNDYYAEDALVQEQNGVLHIASYTPEKLVVWVTVTDLSKLTAYDNAEVKSFGKFSSIDLDVKLYNNASAQLDVDAFTASISVDDHAKADISGTVTEGKLQYGRFACLNAANLAATTLTKTIMEHPHRHFRPMEFAAL